jgi:hypothetical protein
MPAEFGEGGLTAEQQLRVGLKIVCGHDPENRRPARMCRMA